MRIHNKQKNLEFPSPLVLTHELVWLPTDAITDNAIIVLWYECLCPFSNSYRESLMRWHQEGGAVCESQLRLEGGAPMMGLCPSGKRTSPLSWPCKDKARRWPSANQKPTLSMTRRCQHLDLGLLSLQKCKQ